MAFSRNGAAVVPRGSRVAADPAGDDQAKSISMARMKRQGRTYRQIGKFFGLSHVAVIKRVRRVPAEALARYA